MKQPIIGVKERKQKKKQRERKRKRPRKTVKGNHERKSEVNGSERSLDGGGFSGWYVSVASRSRVFFSRPRVVLCLLTVCAREPAKVVPLLINCVIFLQLLSRARVFLPPWPLLFLDHIPSSVLFLFLSGNLAVLAREFNIFRGRRELPFYIYPSAFMLRRRKRRDAAYYLRGSITLRV